MPILPTALDARSPEYTENSARMRALVDDLRARADRVREGGGATAREKHLARGKLLPRDRILIETDAPYLAPHPLRGTLNHSGNLAYINAALAAVLGISPEACAALTAENAMRFFGIPSLPFSV